MHAIGMPNIILAAIAFSKSGALAAHLKASFVGNAVGFEGGCISLTLSAINGPAY